MARRGFTLVEVVVAALLLAVGIIAILGAERSAQRLGASGARRQRAVEAAAVHLDSLRSGCAGPAPARAVLLATDVIVGPSERPVHVDALVACGAP